MLIHQCAHCIVTCALPATNLRVANGQPALASEELGGWGVDLLSGRAVGNHYAADDFTLFKLCRQVQFTALLHFALCDLSRGQLMGLGTTSA